MDSNTVSPVPSALMFSHSDSSIGDSFLTDIDLVIDNSLEGFEQFIDEYSRTSKSNNRRSLHTRLPVGADLATLRAALYYAKRKGIELDLEMLDRRNQLEEGDRAWIHAADEKKLRDYIVELILRRGKRAEEVRTLDALIEQRQSLL